MARVTRPQAQLLRDFLAAASRRDAEAVMALCTADVEFIPIVAEGGAEAYRGDEGVRRWLDEIEERFPGSYAMADDVQEADDALVGSCTTRGRDVWFAWHVVMRMTGGRISSWEFHDSRESAERAAGLREAGRRR